MTSTARHARSNHPRRAARLLRAGLTVAAVGAGIAAAGPAYADAGATAQNDRGTTTTDTAQGLGRTADGAVKGLGTSVDGTMQMLHGHQIDPLANTPVDPLSNGVGTKIADFKEIGTDTLTGPLSKGAALGDLPVVGQLVGGGKK